MTRRSPGPSSTSSGASPANDADAFGDGAADAALHEVLGALAPGLSEPAYERVAVALRRAITLRLFPTDRLPPERLLAQWLGVSRITVRQAVALLQDEGMAAPGTSRRAGTLTGPLRRRANARKLAAFRSDIRDILEFRSILETASVRLAAARRDEGLVERLLISIEANRTAADPSSFRRTDTEFHLAIAQASGNSRLLGAILIARAEFLRWRDLHPMRDNVEENVRDHLRIVESIRTHDEEEAARAMAEHLRGTLHEFLIGVAAPGPRTPPADRATTSAG